MDVQEKHIICRCFDWDKMDLEQMQHSYGLMYLLQRMPEATAYRTMNTYTFRHWWGAQWKIRDREWLISHRDYLKLRDIDSKAQLLSLYQQAHEPSRLTIYPQRVTRAMMVDEIHKRLTIKDSRK